MRTTRTQRGLFLAATTQITEQGRGRYEIKDYQVSVNLYHCTCYDGSYNKCKHQIACETFHQHGRLSLSLALIMAAGGGQLVQARKGGLGKYTRLENNSISEKPLAIEWAKGRDGIERAYPAKIADQPTGFELIPLTTSLLIRAHNPELYQRSRMTHFADLYNALSEHETRSQAAKTRQQKRLRKAA